MRVLLILCFWVASVHGQDTTYWQTGYFHNSYRSVVSLSADTHIFTGSNQKVQITHDNFKSSSDFSTQYCASFNALVYDKFLLYGHSSYVYQLNIETGQEKRLGQVPAWQFLYCNDSLFYTQSLENKIYRSTDQGKSWIFVRDASLYYQWAVTPGGEIFLVSKDNNVYLSNPAFTDTTLLLQYSGGALFDSNPYFSGTDTMMFTTYRFLYKSFDGGISFETTEFGANIYQGVKKDINGNLFILTKDELLKSTDKGETWKPILQKYGYGGGFYIYEDKINVAFWDHQNDAMYHDPNVNSPRYDNYMPLELGNKWYYRALDRFFQFQEVEVYDTVTINSKLYYKISDFQYPMRYENNRLLYYVNDADSLYMDFNIPSGQHAFFRDHGNYYTVREGMFQLFDTTLYNKGPYYSEGAGTVCELFTPGLGKIFSTDYDIDWTNLWTDDTLLVQAIIKTKDGEKLYNNVPAPYFASYVNVDYLEDYLIAKIDVSHNFSVEWRIEEACFIDSVKMYYFLTDGSSNTEIRTVTGERLFDATKYAFICPLDTSNFSQGYEAKCYFRAWTKGVIPVEKRHPELGYITIDGSTVNMYDKEIALDFCLKNNYPNPFNPSTTIRYTLRENSRVVLEVYNIQGQMVRRLVEENQEAGEHTAVFNGENLASGVYIARLRAVSQTGGEVFTKSIKMILMK